jgi:hypothetical protein
MSNPNRRGKWLTFRSDGLSCSCIPHSILDVRGSSGSGGDNLSDFVLQALADLPPTLPNVPRLDDIGVFSLDHMLCFFGGDSGPCAGILRFAPVMVGGGIVGSMCAGKQGDLPTPS